MTTTEVPLYTHGTHEPLAVAEASPLDDLSFADVMSVQILRSMQQEAINNAKADAVAELAAQPTGEGTDFNTILKSGEVEKEAAEKVTSDFDDQCKSYLDRYMKREDNPNTYDKLYGVLRSSSVDKMEIMKWQDGDRDTDGEYNHPETSGKAILKATLEDLRQERTAELAAAKGTDTDKDTSDTDTDDNADNTDDDKPEEGEKGTITVTPEQQEARLKLEAARNKLAELSIRRRQTILKRGKKADALETEYNAASEEYHKLCVVSGALDLTEWKKTQTDIDANDVVRESVERILEEHQNFSQAEHAVLSADDSRRGKLARLLVGRGRLTAMNVGLGVGVGVGVRAATKATGFLVGGPAGWAILAGVGAIRTTKAVFSSGMNNRVATLKWFEKRSQEDYAELKRNAQNISSHGTDEDFARNHSLALHATIGNRINKDRSANARRIGYAALLGGSAAVLGEMGVATHGFGLFSSHNVAPGHTTGNGNGAGSQAGSGSENGAPAGGNTALNGGGSNAAGAGSNPNATGSGAYIAPGNPYGAPEAVSHSGHGMNHHYDGSDHGDTDGGSNGKNNGGLNHGNDGSGHAAKDSAPNKNIDGYNPNVLVENGNGYQKEIIDLLQQKNLNLSDQQTWQAYLHLQNKFPKGNFFTNDASYKMSDGYFGIQNAGKAHWNPAVIHELNAWVNNNVDKDVLKTAAKKSASAAAKVALAGANH